jgi:hypothetical protein
MRFIYLTGYEPGELTPGITITTTIFIKPSFRATRPHTEIVIQKHKNNGPLSIAETSLSFVPTGKAFGEWD